MNRLRDLLVALPLALLLTPVMAALAFFVILVDGRPAFHVDPRVGRGGHVFGLIKIRSMKCASGSAVTAGDDPRLRPWGRTLRRFRLDELPQLWQVVSGQMSLLGPRPESPRLVRRDDPREAALLTCRPGLVDLAVLESLEEEAELSGHADPEDWYRCHMRPRKLELSLQWLACRPPGRDLTLLGQAFLSVFFRKASR